jgi:CelD/BcsL family acetyltransferase involved in cellulose biosynthesis
MRLVADSAHVASAASSVREPQPGRGAKPARVVTVDDAFARTLDRSFPTRTSLFGSPLWLKALVSAYGFTINASIVGNEATPGGAILFSEIEDIRGRRAVSLPFSDYLDPLAETPADWRALVEPILALNAPLRIRCLHSTLPLSDGRFTNRASALWHAVDLRPDEDALWQGLKDSAPQNIRRAERNGVTITEGRTIDDLRTFYELHFHVRKSKYRLFTQPFSFFEALHAAFAPEDRIITLLARLDGQAVAGILFLIHGDTPYYKFNASADLRFRPNDLLIWTGMRLGRSLGLSRLDFGLSDIAQPGLVRFKQKFASLERPIHELRWAPAGFHDERGAEAGALLGKLTEKLTAPEVPDAVTRSVGDQVYRLFC